MTKQSGLGAGFWIDGRDISGDVTQLSRFNTSRVLQELTGIDKLAMERLHGLRDGGMEVESAYNTAAGAAFGAIQDVPPTGQRIAMYVHRNTVLGSPSFAMVCRQAESTANRGNAGEYVWTHTLESDAWGIDWTKTVTAGKRTDTGAAVGTAVDFEAANNFGLQAYLQVFSFTGTDATVKLQMDTADNFPSPTDVTGGGFAVVTAAPQAQRLQTARNFAVERYLRVTTTTSAGFTNLVFAVGVRVNTVVNTI